MTTVKTVIENKLKQVRKEAAAIAKKLNALEEKETKLESALFKLETGYGFGDIFKWNGKEYIIGNNGRSYRQNKKGANNMYAGGFLRDFLLGKCKSPKFNYGKTCPSDLEQYEKLIRGKKIAKIKV